MFMIPHFVLSPLLCLVLYTIYAHAHAPFSAEMRINFVIGLEKFNRVVLLEFLDTTKLLRISPRGVLFELFVLIVLM